MSYVIDDSIARESLERLRGDFLCADRELCHLDAFLVVARANTVDPDRIRPSPAQLGIPILERRISCGLVSDPKAPLEIDDGETSKERVGYAITLHSGPGEDGFGKACEHMLSLGSDAAAR